MSVGVELKGVVKAYPGKTALKGVSLSVETGRINTVIGPNGSGKTTLLRLISRMERADSGSVTYNGAEGAVEPGLPLMRRMTHVSQSPAMFDTTVYKNVAYGLKIRGVPEAETDGRTLEAIELVGLGGMAHAHARRLSGGEAKRAALARAWVRPELILLDEPSSNLDPEGGMMMEALLMRMNVENGTTVMLVTHNLYQAKRLSGNVFFLYGGELVEYGAKDKFFGSPQKNLTKKFLAGEVVF